jgi:hypothetical protein
MKNNRIQQATEGEGRGRGELTDRLLRRHNDPVGLIDVRHAEHHYSRTAGWVAQRFGLLEHWKTRYDVDDSAAAEGAGLVLSTTTGQPQSTRVVQRAADVSPSAIQAFSQASPSPSEEFRVRRRPVEPVSVSPPTTNVIASVSASSGEPPGPELRATDAAGPPGKSEILTSPRAAALDAKAPTIMRKAAQQPVSLSRAGLEGGLHGRGQQSLVQKTGAQGVLASPGRAGRQEPGQSSLIEVSPASVPTLIQRLPADEPSSGMHHIVGTSPDAVVKGLPKEEIRTTRTVSSKPEIRATSPVIAKPEIIWRKRVDGSPAEEPSVGISGSTGGALPLAINRAAKSEVILFRQAEPAPDSTESTLAGSDGEATPSPALSMPADQIDLGQLADRVGRLLSRQLAVERERRGIKG